MNIHNIPASSVKQRLLKPVRIPHLSRVDSCRNYTGDGVFNASSARPKNVLVTTRHSGSPKSVPRTRTIMWCRGHTLYAHNEWPLWYASCSSPTHNVDIAAIITLHIVAIELEMHGAGHIADPFEPSTNIKISHTTENQNLLWTQHQGDNFCTILEKLTFKKGHTKHDTPWI